MDNNWNVEINREGDLLIRAEGSMGQFDNLFGLKKLESGLQIYAHELRAVRKLLVSLFPHASIKNLEAIEAIIKEEFCDARSVTEFKNFLESAHIPYRTYSLAA